MSLAKSTTTSDIKVSSALLRSTTYKEHISPSEWATKFFVLEKESAIGGGTYSYDYAPHAKLPLEVLGDDSVNEVTLLFASQTGKTTIAVAYLNFFMDIQGGNLMFFLPDEKLIPFTAIDRILPSIMRTKNAEGIVVEKEERKTRDNTKNIRYPSGVIRILSSTNASNRKSTPAKCIILDEISEMKHEHVEEISERAKTYEMYGGKILKTSTLKYKNDPIANAYEASELKYEYAVKCPICNKYHIDDFLENLVYPKQNELKIPDELNEEEKLKIYASLASKKARYKCPHCDDLWDTTKKNQAIKQGKWEQVGHKIQNPKRVGFKASSFISMFVSIEAMAYKYLLADTDTKKEVFYRGWLSKIYEPEIKSTPKEEIMKLKSELEPRALPQDCIGIVASVDVQKDHFYYSVYAVDKEMNIYLAEYGRLNSWADLENFVCFASYDGQFPEVIAIDSGFDTSNVYRFCQEMNLLLHVEAGKEIYNTRQGQLINVIPIKGSSNSTSKGMNTLYNLTKIEKDPNTGRAYSDSLVLYTLNTYHYKDSANLHIQKGLEEQSYNRLYIHKDARSDICESLVSEHKIETKNTTGNLVHRYEPIKSNPFNHYWDCLTYSLFLIDLLDFVHRNRIYVKEEIEQKEYKKSFVDYMDEF